MKRLAWLLLFVAGSAYGQYTTTVASGVVAVPFSKLKSVRNGSLIFCTGCNEGSFPCTAGAGNSFAFRIGNAWACPTMSAAPAGGGTTLLTAFTTAQFDVTNSAALADVPGLSVTLSAGKTYEFSAYIPVTDGATGAHRVGSGGTATATYFVAGGFTFAGDAQGQVTTFGTVIVSDLGIVGSDFTIVHGLIVVNAGGTFTITFSQQSATADTSSVLRGASLIVTPLN